MKKILTLLILLLPFAVFAQKVGTISIDLNKSKEKREQQQKQNGNETPAPSSDEDENSDTTTTKKKKVKQTYQKSERTQAYEKANARKEDDPRLGQTSLFKALFSGGVNVTQVDGDQDAGYHKFGANLGVGVLVKFHPNVSASMELIYEMKGAQRRFDQNLPLVSDFKTIYDYVEVAPSINIHDKKLVMLTVGLSLGALVRFKETVGGIDRTDSSTAGKPSKFDMSARVGVTFFIKQRFGIGGVFSYSILSLRPPYIDPNYPQLNSRASGQRHNVITFRLVYILSGGKTKK